jgi:hypothetical protein
MCTWSSVPPALLASPIKRGECRSPFLRLYSALKFDLSIAAALTLQCNSFEESRVGSEGRNESVKGQAVKCRI